MQYQMLLWPHANARYQSEAVKLAESELRLMLDRLCPRAEIGRGAPLDMPGLILDFPEPPEETTLRALGGHSLIYGLFERRGEALVPVRGRSADRLGSDLPAILKYKGKTNETFLKLLINAALYTGDFWDRADGPLEFLDPMCGRATALFVAANMGWNARGCDVDRVDLKEAEKYFKRYLEYHRFKHDFRRESHTLGGGGSAPVSRFDYALTPEADRAGDRRTLALANADAARAGEVYGKDVFHVIACDLPYGIRHDAQLSRGSDRRGNWLETLLVQALSGWKAALKRGGAIALSFNAQNIRAERLRELMSDAGLQVVRGGAAEGFSHWVEQAITRDIVLCKKA